MNVEREKQESLQWFVEFANMDLSQLKPGDRAKLVVESDEFLFPTKDIEQFRKYLRPDGVPVDLEDLAEAESWAFKKRPPRDTERFLAYILHLQDAVKETLESLCGIGGAGQMGRLEWPGNLYYSIACKSDKFHLSLLPLTDMHEDYIRFKLYQILDGFSTSTIQRCPGCGKYYLNFKKREKRFCSPKCMWKVNAGKRREELKKHPGKYRVYLKKQRDIMRRKYEEKRRTELGPNVRIARSGARKD